jgi:site-specific recombinase XerD
VRDLNYQLRQLCRHNKDGSYSTQANRITMLEQIADQLHTLGYRGLKVRSLKQKHVSALTQHWMERGLSPGTIKNRMSALRWWANKIDKCNVVARKNEQYGIPDRRFVGESKAQQLDREGLSRIKDPYVRLSIELQAAFGLRREEAIKFQPTFADQGDRITLKACWTKGGRGRVIPVRTAEQRTLLDRVHKLAGHGALIPNDKNYFQQLKRYERQTIAVGLRKLHGLRHGYAQIRYRELTGRDCPAAGGSSSRGLGQEEKLVDFEARLTISQELGHSREQITATYLGR